MKSLNPRACVKSNVIKHVSATTNLLGAALISLSALAAQTDLARAPLTNGASGQVKPNIMLLMDTSISMSFGHMPDEFDTDPATGVRSVGYKSYQCNVLYFNPNTTYALPRDGSGATLATPSFTNAPYSGYDSALGNTNLTNAFQAYYGANIGSPLARDPKTTIGRLTSTPILSTTPSTVYDLDFVDPPKAAYYYVYTDSSSVAPSSLDYKSARCRDSDTGVTKSATGGGTWTRYTVSAAQQQNFAIWYSYYRTRILLAKSSVSLAFAPLNDNYRVGFIAALPYDPLATSGSTSVLASKYLAIADFGATQRTNWFNKLFAQQPGFSSPMREGLARVGRHYAGKQDGINDGMTGDPVQYSCQPNFTIMTTDGYWNTPNEPVGPVKLDSATLVGQQDGPITPYPLPDPFPVLDTSATLPTDYKNTYRLSSRPIFDGAADSTIVTTTKFNRYSLSNCLSNAYFWSSRQQSRETKQDRASTSQTTRTQTQMARSTSQNLESTSRVTASTTQITRATRQRYTTTTQVFATQRQTTRTASTQARTTYNLQISTTQNVARTRQFRANTSQQFATITQQTRNIIQKQEVKTQTQANTIRHFQTTYQTLVTTTQYNIVQQQTTKTTTQNRQISNIVSRSTSTFRYKDLFNESILTGNACPGGSRYQCSGTDSQGNTFGSITTGPTPVASCTASVGSSANNFLTTTCSNSNPSSTVTNIGPTCVAQTANSGNGFVTITCPGAVVNNEFVTPTNCTNAPTGNPIVACSTATLTAPNTPVALASCTAGTAGAPTFIVTTCPLVVNTTAAVAATSCAGQTQTAAIGNNWTTKTCSTSAPTQTAIPTATTCVAGTGPGPTFTQTSCPTMPVTQTAVPVPAGCMVNAISAAPNYVRTTACNTATLSTAFNISCANQSPNAGNSHTTTTCTNTINTMNEPVPGPANCVNVSATATNNQTQTTCNPVTTISNNAVALGSCVATMATTAPNHYRTACPAPTTQTNIGIQNSCVVGTNLGSFVTITSPCPAAIDTTTHQQNACVPQVASAGNQWVTISCNPPTTPVVTGPTFVATCTASPGTALNNWVTTTCTRVNQMTVNVGVCTPGTSGSPPLITECVLNSPVNTLVANPAACVPAPAPANPVVTCSTTSPAVNNAVNPVPGCVVGPGTSANGWWETTACPPVVPVEAFVSTCPSNQTAALGNSWTSITCTSGVNTSAFVASCTPQTATATTTPKWTRIQCTPNNQTNVAVQQPCVVGTDLGSFQRITGCNTPIVTTNVPVQTCSDQVANSGNNWTTRNCSVATTGPDFVDPATCVPNANPTSSPWIRTTCAPSTLSTAFVDPASCTVPSSIGPGPSFITTTCTTATTGPTPVARGTCTNIVPTAPNWVTTNCSTSNTMPTFVTPGTCVNNNGSTSPFVENICVDTLDGTGTTNPSATCPVPGAPGVLTQAPSMSNSFKEITCTRAPGLQQNFVTDTTTREVRRSGGFVISDTGVVAGAVSALTPVDNVCYPIGALAPLPIMTVLTDGVPGTDGRPLVPVPPANCTAATAGQWPCDVENGTAGGKANTLADVAQYYYVTDLRDVALGNNIGALGTDVSLNNVPIKGAGAQDDRAPWQHMTTFAIGLGVSGVLNFSSTYKTDTTGDFKDILDGNLRSGVPVQWPAPPDGGQDPTTIDDFWHAAVNGRGQYFNANNAQDVVSGVQNVLASIDSVTGAGAAAASSTQQPVTGNNFAYLASYTSSKWIGDLEARQIDLATGAVQSTNIWADTAQKLLENKRGNECDNRKIFLMRSSTNSLVNFTWNTKACDTSLQPTGTAATALNSTEQAFFNSSVIANLTQYQSMTDGTGSPATVDQRTAAAGANLVNFLRGQKGREGFKANTQQLYRSRDAALGAIINAQPVFVKALAAKYTDTGYAAFNSASQSRTPIVYVAANDGMLHAFYAGTSLTDTLGGTEAWAVIPSTVLPNLHKLADRTFNNNFQYTVDGTPTIGDAYDKSVTPNAWKTLLIAGLNSGGKGFYALDVTDPLNPIAQWEFKWSDTCYDDTAATSKADCHIGYSFGNPILTKLANGTWVVIVTSGYNNVNSPTKIGDGVGYLYVLDAFSGAIISKISTGVGDATTPSGLNRIANYVDNTLVNNTTRMVYGGDLLGNVWRFDINGNIAPTGIDAVRLGTATAPNGTAQPITTKPELAELNGKPMVFIGTGRLLGATDLANTQVQSTYGIVDTLPATDTNPLYSSLRSTLANLTITQSSGTTPTRTTACTTNCTSTAGWLTDLVDSKERINIDMKLQLGTLVFASNVPEGTACNIGGYSYLNFVSYSTGLAVPASAGGVTGQKLTTTSGGVTSTTLAVGFNFFQLPDGTVGGFVTGSDGTPISVRPPISIGPPVGKRISWREIVQ